VKRRYTNYTTVLLGGGGGSPSFFLAIGALFGFS
jgi:hypothetical protein